MKSPDETKKGLECCAAHDCKGCGYNCGASTCIDSLLKDISALIQQLEVDKQQLEGMLTHMNQLRDAAAGRALKMEERVHQLEAERDAAIRELKRIGDCMYCKHDELCTTVFPNCAKCEKLDCPCHTCSGWNNWEWRGVQEEE